MADIQILKIKTVYGEILGIFTDLPNPKESYTTPSPVARQFNNCLNELEELTKENFNRFALNNADIAEHSNGNYVTAVVRPRVGSIVRRLEAQYGFGDEKRDNPLIITVNNTNQVTVTVTPIQEIIQAEQDDEIKNLLIDLREALKSNNKSEKTSSILTTLQQKSWEVFIKVLPYILEQLGK